MDDRRIRHLAGADAGSSIPAPSAILDAHLSQRWAEAVSPVASSVSSTHAGMQIPFRGEPEIRNLPDLADHPLAHA